MSLDEDQILPSSPLNTYGNGTDFMSMQANTSYPAAPWPRGVWAAGWAGWTRLS